MAITAEEVLKLISELNNEEKHNLLDNMYDKYYNGGGAVRYSEKENKEEILKVTKDLKQDIEFLSKKVGKFDMYFNRLNNQSSTDREMEIAFLADKLNRLEKEVYLLKQKKNNTDEY